MPAQDTKGTSLQSWVGKIPCSGKWQPTPVFLLGESHGQKTWLATVHGVAKNQTRLKQLSTHIRVCVCVCLYIHTYMYNLFLEEYILGWKQQLPERLVVENGDGGSRKQWRSTYLNFCYLSDMLYFIYFVMAITNTQVF